MKIRLTGILAIFLSVAMISSLGVYAESSNIPDWVKNNAKWWAEGQIGESEFISGIQFLVNQGFITMPVTNAIATDVNLSDNDRAMSMLVTFNGESFPNGKETIYTYSEFQHLSSTVRTSSTVGVTTVTPTTPTFFLAGLPSVDKQSVYRLVDEFVNPSRPPALYDVQVDILTGDGKIIQTWDYRKCAIQDYITYLDSSKDTYRYSDTDSSEIRDLLLWECAGFSLQVP